MQPTHNFEGPAGILIAGLCGLAIGLIFVGAISLSPYDAEGNQPPADPQMPIPQEILDL